MMTQKHAFNARDINSLAAKVLRGKQPRMPDNYSRQLTDLVTRMLAFDERKRPTVAQILQMRFIRDRIKVFLQKQRPHSGKSKSSESRPSSGRSMNGTPEKKKPTIVDADFDTLKVEVGTMKIENESDNEQKAMSENLAMVSTAKAKDFQMRQFLSQGAAQMVQDNENKTVPETYVVQKNVKEVFG